MISGSRSGNVFAALLAVVPLGGCANLINPFVEDGPARTEEWNSPTALKVFAEQPEGALRKRDEPTSYALRERGEVTHWPLWFEDPFEDKGAGREEYLVGWEDGVAMLYSPARYVLNLVAVPVSAVVTPPWTIMESDGELSKQCLGYDHDAIPAGKEPYTPPGEEGEPASESAPVGNGPG